METIDPAKAARVWQRVQGALPAEQKEQGLCEMIARAWTDSAVFLHLARRFSGKESALLRKLSEQEQASAACLKGIYTLITGQRPAVRAVQPQPEESERALRRCYGSKMQSLTWYESRTGDPEYGPIYARLAQQEWEHCRIVLELLGGLKKK